ncbi:LCP family protein [Bacillus massilinigeriensis]|uniref:LCP family protein n=1 Tax=Bacillus mediterraneensis TaxID=1805474 RepID=UPI003D15FDC3
MNGRRVIKRRRRRIRWGRVFLLLLAVVASVSGYNFYSQYQSGLQQSQKSSRAKQEVYEFKGKQDENGSTNILILGSDATGKDKPRADTIMIGSYNKEKGTYKLVSVMRDCYVDIPGHGKNKINAAFAFGGPELLRKTIKSNFGIDLQYYAVVDFEGFVRLIDEAFPNGVKVDVEKRMEENIGVTIEPGEQRLDGEHLLGYVRFRQDAVGDFGRVERQQKAIKDVADQLVSVSTFRKLPKLLGVVMPFVTTNMDTGDVLFIAKGFITTENRNIETLRLPVDGTFENKRVEEAGLILEVDETANEKELKQFLSN